MHDNETAPLSCAGRPAVDMKIQYFSDLHLEFGNLPFPHTDADVIVAAGDIGLGLQGLQWLKQARTPVVYVAGNHEFYQNELHETLLGLRRYSAGSQVHFLERDCFIYKGVRFLGCTLWSELDDRHVEALRGRVSDFKCIRYGNNPLLLTDYVRMHRQSMAWLEEELAKPYHGATVVVTHHAPLQRSWRGLPTSVKRSAYCNTLDSLMNRYAITAWFHGHTHFVNDYTAHGARVLCNPRGYHGRNPVNNFDPLRRVAVQAHLIGSSFRP